MDYEWYRVGYIAINSLDISDGMWFLTADPVVSIPMILAELPPRKELREFLQEA